MVCELRGVGLCKALIVNGVEPSLMGSLNVGNHVNCCDDTCKEMVVGDKQNSDYLIGKMMSGKVNNVFVFPNVCS